MIELEESFVKAIKEGLPFYQKFEKNSQWFHENEDALREKHGGQIVVIRNQKVIFQAASTKEGFEAYTKFIRSLEETRDCYVISVLKPGEISIPG